MLQEYIFGVVLLGKALGGLPFASLSALRVAGRSCLSRAWDTLFILGSILILDTFLDWNTTNPPNPESSWATGAHPEVGGKLLSIDKTCEV